MAMRKPDSTDSGDRNASADEQRWAAEDRKAAAGDKEKAPDDEVRRIGGDAPDEVRRLGGDAPDNVRRLGGDTPDNVKRIGGGMKGGLGDTRADEVRRLGGDAPDNVHQLGGGTDRQQSRPRGGLRRQDPVRRPANKPPANAGEAAAPAARDEPPANVAEETTPPAMDGAGPASDATTALEDEFNISSSEDDLQGRIAALQDTVNEHNRRLDDLEPPAVENTDFTVGPFSSLDDTTDEGVSGGFAHPFKGTIGMSDPDDPTTQNDTLTVGEGIWGVGGAVFWWPDAETNTISATSQPDGWHAVHLVSTLDPYDGAFADSGVMKPILASLPLSAGYATYFHTGAGLVRVPIGLGKIESDKWVRWVQRCYQDYIIPMTQQIDQSGGASSGTNFFATWTNVDDQATIVSPADTTPTVDGAIPTEYT